MKPFTTIAIIVFFLVCLAHVLRIILGWEAEINDMVIPIWISGVGAVFSGLLAMMLWKESK